MVYTLVISSLPIVFEKHNATRNLQGRVVARDSASQLGQGQLKVVFARHNTLKN